MEYKSIKQGEPGVRGGWQGIKWFFISWNRYKNCLIYWFQLFYIINLFGYGGWWEIILSVEKKLISIMRCNKYLVINYRWKKTKA